MVDILYEYYYNVIINHLEKTQGSYCITPNEEYLLFIYNNKIFVSLNIRSKRLRHNNGGQYLYPWNRFYQPDNCMHLYLHLNLLSNEKLERQMFTIL